MKQTQVFNNAKWIIVCKIAQSVIQLIIGMFSARYLGPSNYGLISYASSIVAFALPIMKLGLDATLVHSLVESPQKEGEIMGTSLGLNIISGIVSIVGVSCFVFFANAGETETILVCILYSISIFFAALEMIQYWFQYKLKSKYPSVVMLLAYVVVSVYKIFLLVTSKSVYWFAFTHSIEYGIIGIALLFIYKNQNGSKFTFSLNRAKRLLSKGKHYIVSAMMVVVIQNTDHIMITEMMGKEENGYYAAAVMCVGVVQFVFAAIIDSFRPLILSKKRENTNEYEKNVSRLYGIIIYLSVAQSIAFSLFAEMIVKILYGSEYFAAIPILRILVWYKAFSSMGSVRNVWILAEEKHKYLPIINIIGAGSNVLMNLILIPIWGAYGAAFASFITQFFTNFLLSYIIKPMRKNNELLIKGINPKFMINESISLLKELKNSKRSGTNE